MFAHKPITGLEEAITEAVQELRGFDANSEDYAKVVNQLAKLDAIRQTDKTDRVSLDTLVLVLGNLAGIIVIVGYEQKHVVVSKALSLIGKLK